MAQQRDITASQIGPLSSCLTGLRRNRIRIYWTAVTPLPTPDLRSCNALHNLARPICGAWPTPGGLSVPSARTRDAMQIQWLTGFGYRRAGTNDQQLRPDGHESQGSSVRGHESSHGDSLLSGNRVVQILTVVLDQQGRVAQLVEWDLSCSAYRGRDR